LARLQVALKRVGPANTRLLILDLTNIPPEPSTLPEWIDYIQISLPYEQGGLWYMPENYNTPAGFEFEKFFCSAISSNVDKLIEAVSINDGNDTFSIHEE
jgi:hypothetical protein